MTGGAELWSWRNVFGLHKAASPNDSNACKYLRIHLRLKVFITARARVPSLTMVNQWNPGLRLGDISQFGTALPLTHSP